MDERRAVSQVLGSLKGKIDVDRAYDAESLVKFRISDSRNRGFKKKPDVPLGVFLGKKSSTQL